jgi:hypothetical protein
VGPPGIGLAVADEAEAMRFASLLLQCEPTGDGGAVIVPPSLDREAVRDAINFFVRKLSEQLKVPKESMMTDLHTQTSMPCSCCGADGAKEVYNAEGDFAQKLCDHCNLFCKEEGEHVDPSDVSRVERRRRLNLGASRQEAIEAAQRTGELLDKYLKAKYGKQELKPTILWNRIAMAAGGLTGVTTLGYFLLHSLLHLL